MRKKGTEDHRPATIENQLFDFKELLRYINTLATHKLGYPVSLLTYLGIIDNKILGIMPNSLANVLLNNVGDPFKDSETSLMEVKRHERELIAILEKYYGVEPGGVRGYVTTGGTEGNFAGLWWSKRFLINSARDTLFRSDDMIKLHAKEEQAAMAELARIALNDYEKRIAQLQKIIEIKSAIDLNKTIIQQLVSPTVFYTKGHTHYSIGKIAEILRLNIRTVEANSDGSMNLFDFSKELLIHLGAHPNSSVIVIANIGTTVTGAIDDVPGIKKILDAHKSLIYTIHLDGALTGFVMPILKPFGDIKNYFSDLGANTLAVSAHKYPGLSQPCGIILAAKPFFEKAFEKSERSIEYVGNILDVTITGSRSGLNVLMFYNALHTLGLDKNTDKLAKMVDNNIKNAKYLYHELVKLYGADRVQYPYHFNVIFPKPSVALAKKYQLMLTGENATICVLTNVTQDLINQFIKDLKLDKEKAMNTQPEYTIKPLTKEYINSTAELFIKSFCDSEPITKHLGISYAEYEPYVKDVLEKAVKDGLSTIAVNKENKVIAFCIGEDIANPFQPNLARYPKLKPILALLAELAKPLIKGKHFKKGRILHVPIAAVENAYRGQGISTKVEMTAVQNASHKGYDFAYSEFTNELSEKVIRQFPAIQICNKITFSDFKLPDGQKPFSGLKGGASCYVATVKPDIKLDSLSETYTKSEVTF